MKTNLTVCKRGIRHLILGAVVCTLLSVPVMADGGGDMGEFDCYPIPYENYNYTSMPTTHLHLTEEKWMGDGYYRRTMDYDGDGLSPHEIESVFNQRVENPQEGNLKTENSGIDIDITMVLGAVGLIIAVFYGLSSVISSARGKEVSNEFSIIFPKGEKIRYKTYMKADSKNPKVKYRRRKN